MSGRRGGRGRITAPLAIVLGLVAVSMAVAPLPAGAQEDPPPPEWRGLGGSNTDGERYLDALAETNGSGSDGGSGSVSTVSYAPSPYAQCTFTTAPLVQLIPMFFEDVFSTEELQVIRNHANQDVEDGTTIGDGADAGGFFGPLIELINQLVDRLQAHQHFLNLAGEDLQHLNEPFVMVTCPPGSIRQDVYVWRQGEPPPDLLRDAYIDEAYDRTPFPILGVNSAPAGTPDEPLVVNVETWLWSNDQYGPVQAQAGIPDIVQVTTTAKPVVTEWDPGNGQDPVVCGDGGRAWSPSLDAGAEPTCSLRYLSSSSMSPTGTFTLTRSTRWEVEWVCEPDCGGGPLDPVIVRESREVSVAEIQAIVTDS